jgi:hypothetical protein
VLAVDIQNRRNTSAVFIVDDFAVFNDDTTGFAVKDFLTGGNEGIHGFSSFAGGTPAEFTADTSGKHSGKNNCSENK